MSDLQIHYHFKLDLQDFQKVHQHTKSKWFIPGTKQRKNIHLQSLELPYRIC